LEEEEVKKFFENFKSWVVNDFLKNFHKFVTKFLKLTTKKNKISQDWKGLLPPPPPPGPPPGGTVGDGAFMMSVTVGDGTFMMSVTVGDGAFMMSVTVGDGPFMMCVTVNDRIFIVSVTSVMTRC
jgi:hypothetical protein